MLSGDWPSRTALGGTGRGLCPGVLGPGAPRWSLGDVESWQHVGGAGDRPRSASSERARAAGGGAAAAGEEGDQAGTVGGRAEEGGHLRGNGSSR